MIKRTFVIIILIFFSTMAFCHSFGGLFWRNVYTNYSFDNLGNKSIGLEYNRTLLILNYSYSYQNWVNNNSFTKNNEFTGYIGLGIINYLQIQYGYSTYKESKIKYKTSFMVKDFLKNSYQDSYKAWWEQISVNVFYEQRFADKKMHFFGFGIGYSMESQWGPIIKNCPGIY